MFKYTFVATLFSRALRWPHAITTKSDWFIWDFWVSVIGQILILVREKVGSLATPTIHQQLNQESLRVPRKSLKYLSPTFLYQSWTHDPNDHLSSAFFVNNHLLSVWCVLQQKLEEEKDKLSADLDSARLLSERVLADRNQLETEKSMLVQKLAEQTKLTNLLNVQLKR